MICDRYGEWSVRKPPRLRRDIWDQAKADTLRSGDIVNAQAMQRVIDRGVVLSRAANIPVTSEFVWVCIQNRIEATIWDGYYGVLARQFFREGKAK